MLPTYATIIKTLTDEFHPGLKHGGRDFLLDIALGPVWNGLLSKDKDCSNGILRVASAWHGIMEDGVTQECGYDEWGDDIARYVEQDIGKEMAAIGRHDVRQLNKLYWSFAVLYQAFGDNWPCEAIASRLREMEGMSEAKAAALTEVIWDHALSEYGAFKALRARQAA